MSNEKSRTEFLQNLLALVSEEIMFLNRRHRELTEETRRLTDVCAGLQARVRIANTGVNDVWWWLPEDGFAQLKGLTAPVVMSAETLRALLNQVPRYRGTFDEDSPYPIHPDTERIR